MLSLHAGYNTRQTYSSFQKKWSLVALERWSLYRSYCTPETVRAKKSGRSGQVVAIYIEVVANTGFTVRQFNSSFYEQI